MFTDEIDIFNKTGLFKIDHFEPDEMRKESAKVKNELRMKTEDEDLKHFEKLKMAEQYQQMIKQKIIPPQSWMIQEVLLNGNK